MSDAGMPTDEEFLASLTAEERERLDEAAAKVLDYLKPENSIDWFTAVAFSDAAVRAAAEAVARAWGFKSYMSAGPESRAKFDAEASAVVEAARPIIVQEERRANLRRRVLAYDTKRSASSLQPMLDPYRKAAAGPTVATGANPLAHDGWAKDGERCGDFNCRHADGRCYEK